MATKTQLYPMVPLLLAAEQSSLAGHPTAIGAYNVNFRAQAEGIVLGLMDAEAPGIVQASKGACSFNKGPDQVAYMLLESMKDLGFNGFVSLHLDHGNEQAVNECIEKGFSSVMYDGSDLHPIDNMKHAKEIVEKAHKKGMSVEGELGQLAGVEEDIAHEESKYADPRIIPAFYILTGADALAPAYGTSHGAFKGKTDMVNLGIIADAYMLMKNFGLNEKHFMVSHGSSTVPLEYVEMINRYGGKLKDTSGVPEAVVKQAIRLGMRKVNIDTDLRLIMTGYMRKWIAENRERAENSRLVSLMKVRLEAEQPFVCVDKKERPGAEITDPRDWLWLIKESNPSALKEPYQNTNDEAFIEVMQGIRNAVRKHVAYLSSDVFGGKGLAAKVDSSLTLEKMAQLYSN